jgi:hypothetical protein
VNPPADVNQAGTPRVPSGRTGYHGLPRDTFAGRQGQGLAVLVALSAAQLLDPDRADTDVLNVLWAA